MPYYVNTDEGTLAGPTDIQPSARLSLGAAVGSAITGNASSVIADYAELQQQNKGPRLSREDSERLVKESGVSLKIPDNGYTQSALDILIKRKRDEATRQRIDAATPWSWVGSPIRGGAMLLAGIADPLNVASAFLPVVREARVASMIANAGSRFGVRASIGATEGLAGAALLEAPTYALRTTMQDDYGLADSLINMAFGTVAGGGLHAVGGAVGDILRGGGNPYARFAGLDATGVRQVMDYEAGRITADAFSPTQRRAAGLEDASAKVPVSVVEDRALRPPDIELAKVADAPFARLYETTPERANRMALDELSPDLRAELIAQVSQRAEPRAIAETRQQLMALEQQRTAINDQAEFKRLAKEIQGAGMSRKQAEAAARKQLADRLADVDATTARLQAIVDTNAAASQAEQHLAALGRGEVPPQFAKQVTGRADEIIGASAIARSINGVTQPPASFVVGMASPETREAVMRTAIAHMAEGRLPNVDAVLHTDPTTIGARSTPQDVARVVSIQRSPESAMLGDPKASEAAAVRAKDAPKPGEAGAQDELKEAMDQLKRLQDNLEAGGALRKTVAREPAQPAAPARTFSPEEQQQLRALNENLSLLDKVILCMES